MIGFTKLLCGTATISDVMRQRHGQGRMPADLLQFSSDRSPVGADSHVSEPLELLTDETGIIAANQR